jgi:outer membrane protein assembly factor BamB
MSDCGALTRLLRFSICAGAVLLGTGLAGRTASLRGEDWPQWRGPRHDGVSRESGLPVVWSETAGLAWKCRLPEWGHSTPVAAGNAVFVTSQVDEQRLVLLKIHKTTGRIEWTRDVGTGKAEQIKVHGKNAAERRHQVFPLGENFATPSPATDGSVIVAHFGNGLLAAYDFDGKPLWKRDLQQDYGAYTVWWGHANSPILYQDLVISVCMQETCADLPGKPSPSYVVAHDKHSGREVWLTPRPSASLREYSDAYTTPIIANSAGGPLLLVAGAETLDAYAPATGKRVWFLPELLGNRMIASPVAADGWIYATRGKGGPVLAVKLEGRGQRPRSDIAWTHEKATPDCPTPVVCNKLLFWVSNSGIANCLDTVTGEQCWKERLRGAYRASPLAAQEKIYFVNTDGMTTVVAAERTFRRLAENHVEDTIIASPIASDGKLFLRGQKWLYCLTKPAR